MTDDSGGKPYEVGYGKPPKHTKFRKGKSGNPRGRPKGSRSFASVIQAELKRRVSIVEDGTRKKITKREAIVKQLVNKGAGGDSRPSQSSSMKFVHTRMMPPLVRLERTSPALRTKP